MSTKKRHELTKIQALAIDMAQEQAGQAMARAQEIQQQAQGKFRSCLIAVAQEAGLPPDARFDLVRSSTGKAEALEWDLAPEPRKKSRAGRKARQPSPGRRSSIKRAQKDGADGPEESPDGAALEPA